MSADISRARQDQSGASDEYLVALGGLVMNLSSLEFLLRMVLYEKECPPHSPLGAGVGFHDLSTGDVVPLNAMTSWDSLRQLITRYRRYYPEDTVVSESISDVRDTLAHGRVMALNAGLPISLVRFAHPAGEGVQVEAVHQLTISWMKEKLRIAGEAIMVVAAKHELLRPTRSNDDLQGTT